MERLEDCIKKLGEHSIAGPLGACMCGLFFTLSNFMAQLSIGVVSQTLFPSIEVVFFRSCVQFLILLVIIGSCKLNILVEKADIVSLIFMSLFGFFSILFMYLALENIPISDALVISFTSPVFTAAFGFVILKEKCNWCDGVCGILSFLGVVIVARPKFIFGASAEKQLPFGIKVASDTTETIYLIGAGYALLGGVCLALYFVLSRKFVTKSQMTVCLFYPSLAGIFLSPVLLYMRGERFVLPGSLTAWACDLSVGVLSTLGLTFLVIALRLVSATYVIIMRNLDVIYAFVLQYVAMGIKPSLWSIGGGLIIIVATLAMAIFKQRFDNKCSDRDD